MSTLTLAVIRSLVRSDLNESGTTILSDTELNAIINDGMKDVAVKGLCYENKIAFDNIATTQKIVPLLQATNHILLVELHWQTGRNLAIRTQHRSRIAGGVNRQIVGGRIGNRFDNQEISPLEPILRRVTIDS